MFRKFSLTALVALLSGSALLATIFGSVRGIVHDQQHRPIPSVEVVMKAKTSDYTQRSQTSSEGEFHFDSVPVGEYVVTATKQGFATVEQSITVLSGTAPILHFEMQLASQAQTVTVTPKPHRHKRNRSRQPRWSLVNKSPTRRALPGQTAWR